MLDLKGNDLKLLAYKQLLSDIEKCNPYDGYTIEDNLELFVKQNGYNPFEEIKILWSEIEKIYLSESQRETFNKNFPAIRSVEWNNMCQTLENDLPNDLAKDVFITEFSNRCVKKNA